ncbi:MAG: MFS transporter [Thermodesulfobacteriota bacterium]
MPAYYRRVWGVLLLGWLSLYMVRVGMSPLLAPVMKEFQLSYAQAGLLSSAVFWAYTAMQLPSGFLGDRWGHRRFLLVGTLCWTVLSLLTSLAGSFMALLAVRFFTGMAEGTYFGNDRPLVSHYTPPEKKALGQGISALGMGLGMGLGILCAGWIAELWGWRWVFVLYAAPSLLAFVLIRRVIREPEAAVHTGPAPAARYSQVLTSPLLWMLYLSHFTVMYLFWVLGTWAPTIFLELGAPGVGGSGLYASVLGLVSVPALLISGAVSDRLRRRPRGPFLPLVLSSLVMALLSLVMGLGLAAHISYQWFAVLLLINGAAAWSYFPPFYALLADSVPPRIMGTTYGAANTAGFMASLVAPWVAGLLRDLSAGFASGFYLCAGVVLVGALCCLLAARLPAPVEAARGA